VKVHPAPLARLRRKRQAEAPVRARANHLVLINTVTLPAPHNSPVSELNRLERAALLVGAEGPLAGVGVAGLTKLYFRKRKFFKLEHTAEGLEYILKTRSLG